MGELLQATKQNNYLQRRDQEKFEIKIIKTFF